MGSDGLAVGASEADIDQGVGVQEMLERGQGIETMIVPLEMELLSLHDSFLLFVDPEKDERRKHKFFKEYFFNNLFVSSDDIFLLFLRGSQQHVKKRGECQDGIVC